MSWETGLILMIVGAGIAVIAQYVLSGLIRTLVLATGLIIFVIGLAVFVMGLLGGGLPEIDADLILPMLKHY